MKDVNAMKIEYVYMFFLIIPIVVWSLMYLVDKANTRRRNRSREQIKSGVIFSKISYEDLKVISDRWWQKDEDLSFTLKLMLADALSNEDKDLSNHADLLRNLKKEHEMNQLFSELPENVRLKLRELKATSVQGEEVINQLAASLSTLYSKNQRIKKKERMLALLGLAVGVAGILVSIIK